MKDILVNLFGSYVPVTYILDDGTEIIPAGLSGVDWEYVLGVLLFALCLYSVFRIIGMCIKRV